LTFEKKMKNNLKKFEKFKTPDREEQVRFSKFLNEFKISGDYYEDYQKLVPLTMKDPKKYKRAEEINEEDLMWNVNALKIHRLREFLIKRYSFAVPCPEALEYIHDNTPGDIIEIGAGNGYWAHLISKTGKNIQAFDIAELKDNSFGFVGEPWFEVNQGGVENLKNSKAETLCLIWPYWKGDMASSAITEFQGDDLIYIGEGIGGCTGTDEFFDILDKEWDIVKNIGIPQWDGIHDMMIHFKRKKK